MNEQLTPSISGSMPNSRSSSFSVPSRNAWRAERPPDSEKGGESGAETFQRVQARRGADDGEYKVSFWPSLRSPSSAHSRSSPANIVGAVTRVAGYIT